MYSVGYAGYYAMSLLTFSPAVLFVSLAAHACQFGFLNWFETPHIERVYGGGRKPLAARTPLLSRTTSMGGKRERSQSQVVVEEDEEEEGEEGNVTETETLIETDDNDEPDNNSNPTSSANSSASPRTKGSRSFSSTSFESTMTKKEEENGPISRHDLDNIYFRKDLLIFKNFDPFR